jgi:hypothetical protein
MVIRSGSHNVFETSRAPDDLALTQDGVRHIASRAHTIWQFLTLDKGVIDPAPIV